MCFDAKLSLVAWSFAFIACVYLYKRNKDYDRWNAAFILTFTTIQLLEAGVWISLRYRETVINSILTTFILISLLYQPFVQSSMGFMYSTNSESKTLLKYASLTFALIIGYSLYRVATTPINKFTSKVGEKGHLIWEDKTHPDDFLGGGFKIIPYLYLAGLFVPLLYQGFKGLPLIATGLITAYYSLKMAGKKEFGSYWCYTSVIYSLIAILI